MFTRFVLLDTVNELKFEAKSCYAKQSPEDKRSLQYSKVAYRRISQLASFKIVSTEYLELSTLKTFLPHFTNILLSFHHIQKTSANESDRIKKAFEYANRTIGKPFPLNKYQLRKRVFGSLIKTYFHTEKLSIYSDFKCELMDQSFCVTMDDAICLNAPDNAVFLEDFPLIFIEYSLQPLQSNFAHTDQLKMVYSMAVSLMKLIKHLKHLDIVILEKLAIQGILIGGYELEFITLKPQFGVPVIENGVKIIPFCFVFSSCRDRGRLSLFTRCSRDVDSIGNDLSNADEIHEMNFEDQVKATDRIDVNLTCLRALDCVSLSAEQLAITFLEALRDHPILVLENDYEEDGLDYDWEALKAVLPIPKTLNLANHQEISTSSPDGTEIFLLDGEEESLRKVEQEMETENLSILAEHRKPVFWSEGGRDWISVLKRKSDYELVVYSNETIRASPFIPEFRKSTSLPRDHILIVLEAVTLHCDIKSVTLDQILSATRILLDCVGALRDIHAAGFVHSDVSFNNIGYNKRVGLWQMFDFDQAAPIEESIKTKRRVGTRGLMSKHAKDTGMIRPFDDYIALVNAVFQKYGNIQIFASLFTKIQRALVTTDADIWYKEIFDIFCKTFKDCDGDENKLESDPSYLASLKFKNKI